MRDWDSSADALAATGAQLIILSADTPEVIAAAVVEEGLVSPVTSVSPTVWTQWGVANPRRPELPVPATYIIDATGVVVWAKQTGVVGGRTRAERVTDVVAELARGHAVAQAEQAAEYIEPDWNHAVSVRGEQTEDGTAVVVTVAEGFHVYGRRERNAHPLQVMVDGAPVRSAAIPPGRRVQSQGTTTYWLEGTVRIEWPRDAIEGTLRYQACTSSACGPPTEIDWQTD